jgi:ABC-2 type transport system permease protein
VVNSHAAAHAGIVLFRPLHPLSTLDSGVDELVGTSVFLEPHRRNLFSQPPAENAATVGRFGELTAAVTLQILGPLLILLLIFPAFAGEREQGTLRQLLSLGVRPWQLAAGNAFGHSPEDLEEVRRGGDEIDRLRVGPCLRG